MNCQYPCAQRENQPPKGPLHGGRCENVSLLEVLASQHPQEFNNTVERLQLWDLVPGAGAGARAGAAEGLQRGADSPAAAIEGVSS